METFNSQFESEFEPMQVLGRGGFGLVFEAKRKFDGNHYAVKRISFPDLKERKDKVMREVTALSQLDHSGIVRDQHLFPTEDNASTLPGESFYDNESNEMTLPRCYLYIQLQLCSKDTLKDWLLNNSLNRDSNKMLDIFKHIVSAVHYVHSRGLTHRDLKPSNIFFSMDGNIKIGDFGSVTATAADEGTHIPGATSLTQSSSSNTTRVGTKLYMSPEQCDLLYKLLSHNPDDRPSTVQIKKHNIFTSKLKTTQVPTSNLSNNEPLNSHKNNMTNCIKIRVTYSVTTCSLFQRTVLYLDTLATVLRR
ncbi:unnamed protein product, partial [Medioppia subpectinata]